jgi:hypothetical protein
VCLCECEGVCDGVCGCLCLCECMYVGECVSVCVCVGGRCVARETNQLMLYRNILTVSSENHT